MKYQNHPLTSLALAVPFILNCRSVECACPEMTGALRMAYGSNPMVIRDIDS